MEYYESITSKIDELSMAIIKMQNALYELKKLPNATSEQSSFVNACVEYSEGIRANLPSEQPAQSLSDYHNWEETAHIIECEPF